MTADQAAALSVRDVHELMKTKAAGEAKAVQPTAGASAPPDAATAVRVDRIVVDGDALEQAIDALADGGDSPLDLVNAANTAALARATRDLANAFVGTQRIAGRDGKDGRDGVDGRPGEAILEFRTGYDQRVAAASENPPAIYVGGAIHGTAETEGGWWIERRVGWAMSGVVVELPVGVQSGRLTWADRDTYDYQRSELRTVRERGYFKEWLRADPATFWAMCCDMWPADIVALPGMKWLRATFEQQPAVIDHAIDGDKAAFKRDWFRLIALTAEARGWPNPLEGEAVPA